MSRFRDPAQEAAARRSWTLAEMYLQPLFPPAEEARRFAELVDLAEGAQLSMQAAGLSWTAAHRAIIGLPPR